MRILRERVSSLLNLSPLHLLANCYKVHHRQQSAKSKNIFQIKVKKKGLYSSMTLKFQLDSLVKYQQRQQSRKLYQSKKPPEISEAKIASQECAETRANFLRE